VLSYYFSLCNVSFHPQTYPLSLHDALPIYPFSHSYCYEGGETISYTYVASDPSAVLNLRVDSGQIHPSSIAFPDSKFNVYDSDEIGRSTRLNSSHVSISYAVFCLKKKSTLV